MVLSVYARFMKSPRLRGAETRRVAGQTRRDERARARHACPRAAGVAGAAQGFDGATRWRRRVPSVRSRRKAPPRAATSRSPATGGGLGDRWQRSAAPRGATRPEAADSGAGKRQRQTASAHSALCGPQTRLSWPAVSSSFRPPGGTPGFSCSCGSSFRNDSIVCMCRRASATDTPLEPRAAAARPENAATDAMARRGARLRRPNGLGARRRD